MKRNWDHTDCAVPIAQPEKPLDWFQLRDVRYCNDPAHGHLLADAARQCYERRGIPCF